MRIAHLVLAHKDPLQLERLVSRLEHPQCDIYVHLDKKADLSIFTARQGLAKVIFIKNNVKAYWGAYSLVQGTVNSLQEIIDTGIKYNYINFLSAQDYPLTTNQYLLDFLTEREGAEFMHYELIPDEWEDARSRIEKYHFTNLSIPGKYRLENAVNAILKPKRVLPRGLVAVGRSQWFTITRNCCTYILDYLNQHPEVVRFFKYTWGPDELIFQTIVYNSPFRDKMVNNNLRYIDWAAGLPSPKILDATDRDKLMQTDALFARKFSLAEAPEILDYIDAHILR